MSDSNEVIINRIRKILERSKDPNAPDGEVETAVAMAQKLMDKYHIDEEQILLSSEDARKTAFDSIKEYQAYQRAGKVDQWDLNLAYVCDFVCGTDHVTKRTWAKNKRGQTSEVQQVWFYGLPRDVAVASALYMELLATMRAMFRLRFGKASFAGDERSYCTGFSSRLYHRAQELKKARDAAPVGSTEATANAIVICKDALLERYAEDKYGILSSATLAKLQKEREERQALERAQGLTKAEPAATLTTKMKKVKFRKGRRATPLTDAYGVGYQDGNSVSLDDRGISDAPYGGRKELNG